MISLLATTYLFLGGTSGAALALLSGMKLARRSLPRSYMSRAWIVTLVTLLISILCLSFDLGRFENVLAIMLNPRLTAMTVGTVALIAGVIVIAYFLAVDVFDGFESLHAVRTPFAIAGIFAGMAVMLYTGFLLNGLKSVVAWQSLLIPTLFVVSSASCGIALLMSIIPFVEQEHPLHESAGSFLRSDTILIVTELVLLALFIVMLWQDARTVEAARALAIGDLAAPFWLMLVGLGLVLPLVMERMVSFRSDRYQFLWLAAALFAGGFTLRWLVVELALFDPARYLALSA